MKRRRRGRRRPQEREVVNLRETWKPRTILGMKVLTGQVRTIQEALRGRRIIKESEIVDFLIPSLKEAIIPIGGTPGKGGGKKRILARKTSRMHKSGRRMSSKAMVIVGNENGVVGLHEGSSVDTREAIQKALKYAKLSLIEVRRGCGSWEDVSDEPHSVPFTITGKSGSVTVTLHPAPRGIGLATGDALKPLFRLAGIRDIWVKSRGHTKSRENLLKAAYDALLKLSDVKVKNYNWKTEIPEPEPYPEIKVEGTEGAKSGSDVSERKNEKKAGSKKIRKIEMVASRVEKKEPKQEEKKEELKKEEKTGVKEEEPKTEERKEKPKKEEKSPGKEEKTDTKEENASKKEAKK